MSAGFLPAGGDAFFAGATGAADFSGFLGDGAALFPFASGFCFGSGLASDLAPLVAGAAGAVGSGFFSVGFAPRFGLFSVDEKSGELVRKGSAEAYRRLVRGE